MSYTKNLQNAFVAEDAWFNNLIKKINALEKDECDALKQVTKDAFDYLQKKLQLLENSGSGSEIEALVKKILNAVSNLTSLSDVINIVKDLVTLVTGPYVKAIETNIAQILKIVQQVAEITSAIEKAAANMVSCTISVPSLPVPIPTPFTP